MTAVLILVSLVSLTSSALAITTRAKQALIVDLSTNTILYEKNADQRMAPSSMTKMMTAYILFDQVAKGNISLDDTVKISARASKMGGSKMFIRQGSNVSYRDLVTGLMVVSGNDSSVAIAEGIAGSESAFAALMNQTAQQLHMSDTNFVNASGMPDEQHYSTARDLARIAAALHTHFPQYDEIYTIKKFVWDDVVQLNRNPLLSKAELATTGLKTGYTSAGGYGVTATSNILNRRIIMVLNGLESTQIRRSEAIRMMDWAQRNWSTFTLIKKDQILDYASVWMGTERIVPLTINADITRTLQNKSRETLSAKTLFRQPLEAPIAEGMIVGVLRLAGAEMEPIEVALVTSQAVPRLGLVSGVVRSVQEGIKARIQ